MLPTGIVTFLFTDIEGSSSLWESKPQAMKLSLAQHHTLLHQSIETNGGIVFKIIGDSFNAAFSLASNALDAALAAQRALAQAEWGQSGPLLVRMGLHTGPAELLGNDYTSTHTLNRVSRIMSAAYGGQILLSKETADLLLRDLPAGVSLKDLGEHQLRGMTRLEQLVQVQTNDLRSNFPALETQVQRPNYLPIQLTSFVGRKTEIEAIRQLLIQPEVSFLTLTGVGGIGKSRLAVQAGSALLGNFSNGVFFVPLAPVRKAELVLPTIAETLGLRESAGRSFLDLLKEHLARKQLLLILDNFEQVVEAGPALNELLTAAPGLKLLVTSRSLLRLSAEHSYPVGPLNLPDPADVSMTDRLSMNEAVRLFIHRAQAVKADFQLTQENAQAVAEICRRLDGLPLAIELAAARTRLLPPQKILTQLGSRLRMLVGGARDLPARHQTMRAAIDWSHDLLADEEQVLFRRLAVFAGGCSLEAAQTVCGSDGIDVISGLENLLDKNLILQSEINSEPRFWAYETIREYGLERLESSGEGDAIHIRHALFYINLAHKSIQQLDQFETEIDNMRAVLRWAIDFDRAELGFRLTNYFWFWAERVSEGLRWMAELVALPSALGHPFRRGYTIFNAGILAIIKGDLEGGQAWLDQLPSIGDRLNEEIFLQFHQYGSGIILLVQSDYSGAIELLSDLTKKIDQEKNWLLVIVTHAYLGAGEAVLGDFPAAELHSHHAMEIAEKHRYLLGAIESKILIGYIAYDQGNYGKSKALLRESLSLAKRIGFRRAISRCICGFAAIAQKEGDLMRAARLFGASDMLHASTGARHDYIYSPVTNDDNLIELRSQLGNKIFEAAWEEGSMMTADEAILHAFGEV